MAKNGFSECNTRNEGAKTKGEAEMGIWFSDDRGVFEKGREGFLKKANVLEIVLG